MTDLKRLATYLADLAETQPEPVTLGQLQLILNRFESHESSAFKVLIPSVCAWQAVWEKCAQLGMKTTDKADSSLVVCDFISKIHANQKPNEPEKMNDAT